MATFGDRLLALAQEWWDATSELATGHRELMKLVVVALASRSLRDVATPADERRLAACPGLVERLASLQGADGLFTADGNISSPPDSAFALTDLAIALELAGRLDEPGLDGVVPGLRRIAHAAMPALIAGGVHTPNHRWEMAAALVGLADVGVAADLAGPARARAREWLSEGVDVDADGLYSERSAIYAALVSNPSLLTLATALDRPDLADVVHRNLHAVLDLTDADGVVETLFSRRQDHRRTIPVELFHLQLRRFALGGCAVCVRGAQLSEPSADGGRLVSATDVAAVNGVIELALHPELGEELGQAGARPPRWSRRFDGVRLLVAERDGTRVVVSGGSDVPHVGRVGSGLAANPTFLRYRSGAAVIRSLRLSRVFFGLGPFRAESLGVEGGDEVDGGVLRLHERVAAAYYQPLPPSSRRPDGAYRLTDDGRFSAAMAFDERAADEVALVTDIDVRLGDAVELTVRTSGPRTRWSLEIALGEGELSGMEAVGTATFRMTGRTAELRAGDDAVVIETTLDADPDAVGFYEPGEVYAFLGGTDALDGRRLYLTGTTPGTTTVTLGPR